MAVKGICKGGTDPDRQCRDGHHGPFCFVCDPEWFQRADGTCERCDGNVGASVALPAIGLAVCLAGLIYFCRKGFVNAVEKLNVAAVALTLDNDEAEAVIERSKQKAKERGEKSSAGFLGDEGDEEKEHEEKDPEAKKPPGCLRRMAMRFMGWLFRCRVKLKFLIGLYQLLTGMAGTYSIKYPDSLGVGVEFAPHTVQSRSRCTNSTTYLWQVHGLHRLRQPD
jgi:hypothetical protein